jgi:OOP family OmpA-OmpF porin
MKTVQKIGTLSLLACAMLAAQFAHADEAWDNPEWANSAWYLGAGAGKARATIDRDRLVASLTAGGATAVNFSSYERDTGYKLFIGKQLNKNFALEASYYDLGNFGFNATTTPGNGILNGDVSFRGGSLDLLAQLPLSQRFSIYGRIGANYTKADAHFTGNRLYATTNPNPSESKFNPKLGLGVEFKLTEALALRGEVERYRVNDAVGNRGDVDFYSIDLLYKLGKPAAKPAPVFVPPPVAPPVVISETAPAAAPVVPAPVATSEKQTFAAKTLFDFDKSVLKPEGKAALNDMLGKLAGLNLEVMIAVGHTDSVGSNEYNQRLSIRRAEAVKVYLVSQGVDGSRIYTEGKDETQPVADNKTADGRMANRRVTVEVVGTRTVMK